jgi:CrcB protein
VAYVAIALGAALGANLRYLVGLLAVDALGTVFPYGTLFINVSGSLVLAFGLTWMADRVNVPLEWRLAFGTGCCGAYTTFSSYTYETAHLFQAGEVGAALLYLVGSVVLCFAAAIAGIAAAEAIT